MKVSINLGEQLHVGNVKLPTIVPVVNQFDYRAGSIIGEATLFSKGSEILAEVSFINDKYFKPLEKYLVLNVAVYVNKRNGDLVTPVQIVSVSASLLKSNTITPETT